jgi:very-short-patch-repair endonuclease
VSELDRRLAIAGGVLCRAEHRDLAGTLDRSVRNGRLLIAYPGIYVPPGQATVPLVRIRAAAAWVGRDAVLIGWAAARLTYWSGCPLPGITFAQTTTRRRARGEVSFERWAIPLELTVTVSGMRVTRPNLTAVDLAATELGGEAIDVGLRTRTATLQEMWEAFAATRGRPGNRQRRRLLMESRESPWSEAERNLHRLFFRERVTGWAANVLVEGYYVDVLFASEKLIVEVDGRSTQGTRAAFEADRERRNVLELAGYLVLNFTWQHILGRPEWVLDCIARARQMRATGRAGRRR